MKAKNGNKIKLIENVCYGSIHGLVEVEPGTILNVQRRSQSDDGIVAMENISFNGPLGKIKLPIEVWDREYIVLN